MNLKKIFVKFSWLSFENTWGRLYKKMIKVNYD